MNSRVISFLVVVLLAEMYSAILVFSASRDANSVAKTAIIAGYVAFSLACWAFFVTMRQPSNVPLPATTRNLLVSLVMGVFVGKLLVMLLMFADDLRRLITWIIYQFGPAERNAASRIISRSIFLKRTAIVLAGLSLSGFLWGMSNRFKYHVRKVSLKFPDLPDTFRKLTIVQLSDIHTGSLDDHNAVELGIRKVLSLQPDAIVFTGDLVNNRATEVDAQFQRIYSLLKAPLGVFSVLGNHDYGDYVEWPSATAKHQNLHDLKALQAAAGWRLLMNEHVVLQHEGARIGLVGIENWGAKANFARYGDMPKACDGLTEKETHINVLLSHDPSHWDAQVRNQYPYIDLMLSGHTHGMQFGIDSKVLKWSPVQYLYRQWAGLYQEAKQYLYVNRGFGFLGYAGRIGIMPEITLIEITR
ncbi:MAG: metallophosphoesterase [Chitinophagia bacterium]|nr:metallophosphoesterase [Chitinophagia bacterium]